MAGMIHFLGQVFVTLWPVLLAVAVAPLNFLFLFSASALSSYFILGILLSQVFFGCLGFAFFFIQLLRLFPSGRNFLAQLKPTAKLALFGIFVVFMYLLSSLLAFLSSFEGGSFFIDLDIGLIFIMLLVFAGVASTLWYAMKGITWLGRKWIHSSSGVKRTVSLVGAMLFLYPFFVILTFLIWLFWNPLDGIAQYDHHTLNAAVKNTCLLDPTQENCPQKLEDIRIIVPEVYDRVLAQAQVKYEYNSEENTYILVIRYNPVRAAVFSNRFENSSDWKADYKEHEIEIWGQDRLKDPLLPGDWTFPEWRYRIPAPYLFWYH